MSLVITVISSQWRFRSDIVFIVTVLVGVLIDPVVHLLLFHVFIYRRVHCLTRFRQFTLRRFDSIFAVDDAGSLVEFVIDRRREENSSDVIVESRLALVDVLRQ
jgi:hypothetical protein